MVHSALRDVGIGRYTNTFVFRALCLPVALPLQVADCDGGFLRRSFRNFDMLLLFFNFVS